MQLSSLLSALIFLASVSANVIPSPKITSAPQLDLRSPHPHPTDNFHVTIAPISLNLPSNTCHPTIKPDKNGSVPPTECNALYRFYPSFGAAILFLVLFGVVTVTHIAQAAIYKKV